MRYSVASGTWETWNLPAHSFNPAAAIVNNKMYVFHGQTRTSFLDFIPNTNVREFDPARYH